MPRRTFRKRAPRRLLGGDQSFCAGGAPLRFRPGDYWRWSGSDLLGNTGRGVLAEYLVGCALDAVRGPRLEWGAHDLLFGAVKVEVKSAAYFQSWPQKRASPIRFGVGRRRHAWDSETGTEERADPPQRWADVYVFCELGEPGGTEPDPFNLDEWRSYVASRAVLDEESGDQKTVSRRRLGEMGCAALPCDQIRAAVERAAR